MICILNSKLSLTLLHSIFTDIQKFQSIYIYFFYNKVMVEFEKINAQGTEAVPSNINLNVL